MTTIRSSDAQLYYEVIGDGPTVVLLHPFPLNHNFLGRDCRATQRPLPVDHS